MKKILPIILLCIVSLGAIRPLLTSGYFPMHDDTQVARVIEMGRSLRDKQFPVRWVSDLGYGYGYPIFNFYGPLPYYVGGILYVLGIPALVATKIMFGLGIALPSLVLYLVLTSFVPWPSAFVGAILYLYAPYHAVQIYVRGSVGEYWMLLFWPLILYAVLKNKPIAGAIGVAGAILSHTLLGYATSFFMLLIFVFQRRIPAWFWFGLGLSAFFWLPALKEMNYTSVSAQVSSTANYSDHFVCLIQLWSSVWGFGGSAKGCTADGMAFMLGKVHIMLAVIALFWWRKRSKVLIAGFLCFAVGILLSLSISEPIWRVLPYFPYMQYPWRFLSLATFGLSLIGAFVVSTEKTMWKRMTIAFFIVCATLFMNVKWFVPQYTYERQNSEFESSEDIRWRVSRISNEYLPKEIVRPRQKNDVVSDTIVSSQPVSVTTVLSRVTEKEYVVESTTAAILTVNIANFPGWEYRLNGNSIQPRTMNGLSHIAIGPGQSVIKIRLKDTMVRLLGNIISGITVFIIIFWYGKHKKASR